MTESTKLDALIATAGKLSSDYQRAINMEENNRSKAATTQIVIREKARQQFQKKESPTKGRSFLASAANTLMQTDFMKDKSAINYERAANAASEMAATIEKNIVRTNSLIRSASYWENFKDVDTKRMTGEARRNQDALPKEIVHTLKEGALLSNTSSHIKPLPGEELHTYGHTYTEHEEIGAASTLKHEPEDLIKVLDYIEGYHRDATMGDVIKDHTKHGDRLDADVLVYLSELSHVDDHGLMNTIPVNEVEKAVLSDAPDAGLSVSVKKAIVEKSASKNVANQPDVKKQFDHKAYQKTLVTAALELSTINDKMSFDKLPSMSNSIKSLREQMVANNKPGLRVDDLKKYIHAEADREGVTKAVENIEKYGKSLDKKTTAKLTPKEKQSTVDASIDGGRKMGESRPGANSIMR